MGVDDGVAHPTFGRSENIGDHDVRQQLEGSLALIRPGGDWLPEEITRRRLEGVSQRSGSAVSTRSNGLANASADDDQLLDTLTRFDRVEDLDGIEAPFLFGATPRYRREDAAPSGRSEQPVPCMSGGADMATSGVPAWYSRVARGGQLVGMFDGAVARSSAGRTAGSNRVKSSSGYMTPLGMPVVPPV